MKPPFRVTITGFTEKEVNKRVIEAMERDVSLRILIDTKLVKDNRRDRAAKWCAVLGEKIG